ncbi:MAG: hypothetical protein AAB528_02110, partial [Chloroflexota bacterium]
MGTAVLGLLLAACAGGPRLAATPDPRIDRTPEKLDQPAQSAEGVLELRPDPTSPLFIGSPPAPPTPRSSRPAPTPNPSNSPWVRQRLQAGISIYDLSDA